MTVSRWLERLYLSVNSRCAHKGKRLVFAVSYAGIVGAAGCAFEVEPAHTHEHEAVHATSSALTADGLAPRLDPNTIPKFAHELPRFATFKPRIVSSLGRIVRFE